MNQIFLEVISKIKLLSWPMVTVLLGSSDEIVIGIRDPWTKRSGPNIV